MLGQLKACMKLVAITVFIAFVGCGKNSPSEVVVYTALDRLEGRQLVSSHLGDPTAQRGGKRKRYYRLEPAGAALLRESQAALARMARGLMPELKTS